MKRAAVAAALALLASEALMAQADGVLKIGFYYSTAPSAEKVVFTDGVNLIPGNNDQSTRLPGTLAAGALKQPGGAASPWGVTVTEEVGGSGAAMASSAYTEAVTGIFPAATVSGLPNGVPLQGSASASLTFDGVTPGNLYRVTALVGRGNTWDSGKSVYRVGGTVRLAAVSAQSEAGATVSGTTVTATVQSGAWALMTFETVASEAALALTAEGHGSIQGVMLEDLGAADAAMVWTTAGDGSWTDAANWAGYDGASEVTAYLPDVACDAVTVEAAGAVAKAAVCTAAATVYTLKELPDAVAVASSGALVLADGEGSYGHAVTSGTVYVTGEEVAFGGTAGRIEVASAVAGDGSERPGALCLTGSASDVTLERGCTLSGSGTVSGTLTVAPGVCLAPADGAPLTVGAVTARVPDFEAVAWPYGEPAMTGQATVTVRPGGAGCLLSWGSCGEGVAFVLPEGVPGALERRTDGLWYVPPEEPGYRLRLK